MQTQSVENVFSRSWELLSANWIIIVPGLVVGLIVGLLTAIFTPHTTVIDTSSGVFAYSARPGFLVGLVALLGAVVNIAYTTGMAGAAWRNGTTSLADGAAALREDFGRVLLAVLLFGLLLIVLAVLSFGVLAAVFLFFSIYMMPSVVLSGSGPWSGLKESFAIASKRWSPTLVIVLLLLVVFVVVGLLIALLSAIPYLGPIVAAVVDEAVVAYATLVIVGEYLNLRATTVTPA